MMMNEKKNCVVAHPEKSFTPLFCKVTSFLFDPQSRAVDIILKLILLRL